MFRSVLNIGSRVTRLVGCESSSTLPVIISTHSCAKAIKKQCPILENITLSDSYQDVGSPAIIRLGENFWEANLKRWFPGPQRRGRFCQTRRFRADVTLTTITRTGTEKEVVEERGQIYVINSLLSWPYFG